ncbi:hypothetical protein [Celeribacter sp.]|uniref:hypothetical protein n=1 Tax=Celeribacter sp. TaxID=1890673 RepID=UPI003A8FB408
MTVFIQKGDPPMTKRQAIKRGLRHFDAEKAQYEREAGLLTGSQAYAEWANQWLNDNVVNEANNIFNIQLAAYRAAVERLAKYRLADGRPETSREVPTGLFDEEGAEIVETVITPAIEPLEPTVERMNEEGEAEQVPNPLIVADDAERDAAQAVIDATPEDVKAFAQA